MNCIIGLGNPEPQFDRTRHNAGFMILNQLAPKMVMGEFTENKKCRAEIAKKKIGPREFLLVKPMVYMNESGISVRAVMDYYKITESSDLIQPDWHQRLFVIHDDLDLPLGTFKIQFGTGPKLHNGLLSVYQHLGTKNFWHVRVGVDGRSGERVIPPPTYVTQHFSENELGVFAVTRHEVIEKLTAQLGV